MDYSYIQNLLDNCRYKIEAIQEVSDMADISVLTIEERQNIVHLHQQIESLVESLYMQLSSVEIEDRLERMMGC